jgi:hypothetical protein
MPISTFPCHDYDEDEYILKPAGLRDTHSEGKVSCQGFCFCICFFSLVFLFLLLSFVRVLKIHLGLLYALDVSLFGLGA